MNLRKWASTTPHATNPTERLILIGIADLGGSGDDDNERMFDAERVADYAMTDEARVFLFLCSLFTQQVVGSLSQNDDGSMLTVVFRR